MRSSRQMSNSINSINRGGFRSPRIRPTSPEQKSNEPPTMNYLSSPKFELLHEKNRINSLGFYIEKDDERQRMRKENNNFSNLIDNYYNSEIHKRSWWPNGGLIIKRRYKYTGIGLDHFYEKNNVEQLETIEDSQPKEKKDVDYFVQFPEFENLKYNEYMITIEHCASCEEHKYITQHQTDAVFKELALNYGRIIRERFPFIKVYLKPIDVEIVKNTIYRIPKVQSNGAAHPPIPRLNTKFKQCRIGAFEIQIATRNEKGQIEQRIIHSKLKTKKFPEVNSVLKKIVSFIPRFRLKLVLFDKEDYEEIEKMDNIQVNLYLCNSKLIKQVKDSAKLQVLNFTSPSRRLLMLKEQRFKLQQQNFLKNKNLFKNRNFSPISTQRITSALPLKKRGLRENSSTKIIRPISSMSYNFNDKFFETNKSNTSNNTLWINSANPKDRGNRENKLSFSTLDISKKFGKDTNNQEKLKLQKGELIKRKFSKVDEKYKITSQEMIDDKNDEDAETSESVTMFFDEIPYDTYIIETVENSNFQGSLTLLKFNEIKTNKDNLVTKYIGLWHQENAILNIHLYTEKEKSIPKQNNGQDNNPNYNNNIIIPNSGNPNQERKIIRPPSSNQRRRNPIPNENNEIRLEQEPISTGSINISKSEDPNSRYKVYPNGKGIYEYKTTPGEYKLEVTNDDYEKIVMKVLLKSGLNTINIKMKQEKCCNLKIQVFEYNEIGDNYGNYYIMNNINEEEEKKDNKNPNNNDEEEKNDNKNPEDNIIIEPVRNAEIQIFKDANEILVEGITNKKGVMKYLVDKNENNLLIKVSKNGYYRVERVFKRNNDMKENENGNYECTMTFILVKIERLMELDKMIFISYSNTLKKIFEFDVQNVDEERNKWIEKDMQEINGVFMAVFKYEDNPRENDEAMNEEIEDKNKLMMENNNISSNNNNLNDGGKSREDINDFNENIYYEEIVRLGLRISLDIIKDEYNQTYEVIRQNDSDLIEYLRNICSDGNIYTPNYDFHINLPKVLSKNKYTPKFYNEGENNNEENTNNENSNNINSNSNSKSMNKNNVNEEEEFSGIYWDLGWVDLKNYLFYETSVYFKLEYKPERCLFFENFIDFLQIFIDQRICDSIFNFFNYEMSILAGSDRYLPKTIFESKLLYIMDEENRNKGGENNKINNSKSMSNKLNQKQKQMKKFIQFICDILCGYDEENNIKDDSISFYLLRKKISSNLQNFLNFSSDGKKETNKTEENREE